MSNPPRRWLGLVYNKIIHAGASSIIAHISDSLLGNTIELKRPHVLLAKDEASDEIYLDGQGSFWWMTSDFEVMKWY